MTIESIIEKIASATPEQRKRLEAVMRGVLGEFGPKDNGSGDNLKAWFKLLLGGTPVTKRRRRRVED